EPVDQWLDHVGVEVVRVAAAAVGAAERDGDLRALVPGLTYVGVAVFGDHEVVAELAPVRAHLGADVVVDARVRGNEAARLEAFEGEAHHGPPPPTIRSAAAAASASLWVGC